MNNKIEITLFEEKTFILGAEYLMAIMLNTGRSIDNERLIRFINEAVFEEDRFNSIIDKYGLTEKYNNFKKRING